MHKMDRKLDHDRKVMKKLKFKGQYSYTKYKNMPVPKPGSKEDIKLRKTTEKYLAKRDKYYNLLSDSWNFEEAAKTKGYKIKSKHNMFK